MGLLPSVPTFVTAENPEELLSLAWCGLNTQIKVVRSLWDFWAEKSQWLGFHIGSPALLLVPSTFQLFLGRVLNCGRGE